ncbi:metal-dependent hydrolase [Marinobacterium jannaschii]|uniref:metal-dependent hydrolase n=1 Tax=Marinobacterium jannaschii TaxID=64970 RepID=UPI0004845B89|nr:metal-dependent hydrolase [Marinobacterium jannaschii]
MADFKTHITTASIGSAMLATALVAGGGLSAGQGALLWLVGSGAGILPDIDSDSSRSIRYIFTVLAVACAISLIFLLPRTLSVYWFWGALAISFVSVRYGVMELFARFSVHRGIWHSLLAGVFCSFLAVWLSYEVFAHSARFSWLIGLFTGFGFLIHLLLDELYSVDLEGFELKTSFGSATKLLSLNSWPASLLLLVLSGALFWMLPDISALTGYLQNQPWERLLALHWPFQVMD